MQCRIPFPDPRPRWLLAVCCTLGLAGCAGLGGRSHSLFRPHAPSAPLGAQGRIESERPTLGAQDPTFRDSERHGTNHSAGQPDATADSPRDPGSSSTRPGEPAGGLTAPQQLPGSETPPSSSPADLGNLFKNIRPGPRNRTEEEVAKNMPIPNLGKPAPIFPRSPRDNLIQPDGVRVPQNLELTVLAPARRQIGSHATYRLTLRNSGDEPAENVTLHCEFDKGLVFTGSKDREVLQRLGKVQPGESREIALSLYSDTLGSHCCRFTVHADDPKKPGQRKEIVWKSVCVEFVARQLQIDVLGPHLRTVGSRAEFTVTVVNRSGKPLVNVRTSITYDSALEPKEVSKGAQKHTGSLTWDLGTLDVNEQISLQAEFQCKTEARRACLLIETAGKGIPDEQTEACLEITPVLGLLDLRLSDGVDPLEVGQLGQYEATVQNIGLQAARNLQLELTLPLNLKFQSADVWQGDRKLPARSHLVGQKLLFDVIDELGPDQQLRFVLDVKALQPGDTEVRASLTSSFSQQPVTTAEPTSVVPE